MLAAVIAVVASIAAVIARRTYDFGPVASLSILAVLTAVLIWQLRNRTPFRNRSKDLDLRSK